jgi:hypothetical protein
METDDDFGWDDVDDDAARCPDCGAYPEEYHEMDCGYDDDDDIDAEECADIYHPGCPKCEQN